MQDSDSLESSRPGAEERAPGLSPVRAFLLLATVATLIPLGIFATRDEAAPAESPGAARSPDYSLTNAEALQRFDELHDIFRSASIHRDVSLLDEMLVADSPLHGTARAQIRQLISDGVLDRSRFVQQAAAVVENSPIQVEIDQVVRIQPRFVSETTGSDVSADPPLVQRVRWTLMLESSVWKVHDSVVKSSRVDR